MSDDIKYPDSKREEQSKPAKKKRLQPNWPAIKQEFMQGHMNLKALADKLHMQTKTVQCHAWHERWIESREDMNRRADEMNTAQTIEAHAKAAALIDQSAHDVGVALMSRLLSLTLDGKPVTQITAAASALKTLYPLLRQVEGLPAEKTYLEPIDPMDGLQPILHFNDKGEPFLITHTRDHPDGPVTVAVVHPRVIPADPGSPEKSSE